MLATNPERPTIAEIQNSDLSLDYEPPLPWVLCIDDDEDFLYGLKLSLQRRGYDVIRAVRGKTGFEYAFEFSPCVILLDLNLPHCSGEQILSDLQYHPVLCDIPVIIVTGMYDSQLESKLLGAGASCFFRKPVATDKLGNAVDRLAGRKRENALPEKQTD